MDCGTTGDGYVHDPTLAQSTFSEGDRVCFKIRVQFPVRRGHPQPERPDFLPPGLTYEPARPGHVANTAHFTVDELIRQPALPDR